MENKKAVISLIMGILAFIPIIGFILAPIAIIVGSFGTRNEQKRAMAISGIILGSIALVFNIIFFIFLMISFIIGAAMAATCSIIGQSCQESST